jgi:hypothetical protein
VTFFDQGLGDNRSNVARTARYAEFHTAPFLSFLNSFLRYLPV